MAEMLTVMLLPTWAPQMQIHESDTADNGPLVCMWCALMTTLWLHRAIVSVHLDLIGLAGLLGSGLPKAASAQRRSRNPVAHSWIQDPFRDSAQPARDTPCLNGSETF